MTFKRKKDETVVEYVIRVWGKDMVKHLQPCCMTFRQFGHQDDCPLLKEKS